ncbi:MAG: hypothetical protein AB7G47_11650 [Mycolicibacterium sp.]|uniref:hypothetical protein n=1 Tax=Mycolicibacterium sp. TaxID=2320850 RepID=UPI003D140A58
MALLSPTACHDRQPQPDVTLPDPPVVRHDTAQLARIFPALGDPVSAAWIVWDNRDNAAKLRLQWIDAVVRVAPQTMDDLVHDHESHPTEQRPAVQKVLETYLPPGPFRSGVELNMVFGAERRSTRAFLDPVHETVVLQSSIAG